MKPCDDCGVPLAVSAYRVRHAHDSYEDCIAALLARLAKVEPVYEAAITWLDSETERRAAMALVELARVIREAREAEGKGE